MWRDSDVQSHGDGIKHLRHPKVGPFALEYSAFAVDGRPDLSLIVYNPATSADQKLVEALVNAQPALASLDSTGTKSVDRCVDAA